MHSENAAKAFLMRTREKANEIIAAPHVGADVKAVISDLLRVAEGFQQLMEQAAGQTADQRIIRRRLHEAKFENKQQEQRLIETQKMIISMATQIEMVNVETNLVLRNRTPESEEAETNAILRIQMCAKKIIEVVTQLAKANAEAIKESKTKES